MNLVSKCFLNRLTFYLMFCLVSSTSSFAAEEALPNARPLTSNDSLVSQKMWKNIGDQTQLIKDFAGKSATSPLTARLLELDELGFKSLLSESVKSNASLAARAIDNKSNIINLPLPDGSQVEVNITPSKVMTDVLAQKFPKIKTWKITGVSDEIAGAIDFTHHGFHGMLLMPDGDRVFIQPDNEVVSSHKELSVQGRYITFSEKQNKDSFKSDFSCDVHDNETQPINVAAKDTSISESLSARPAPTLITYRLAVAATGEYTQASGGSIASALSSIATTISRVNELYVRDLGIVFELVDEQDDIIYTNPDTDPYNNSNIRTLILQNNVNLSDSGALSKDRYDVGHVFGAGNVGGLAFVGGVCNDEEKAFGATGITNPFGDAFALDYVAHELGHQLGGTHTFNSACGDGSERTGETAVEPGSGTTIMAYPGICQSNNLQNSVDPQFHVVSIDQITTVTREGGGSNCGLDSSSSNQNPTIDAGEDTTIPARTPLAFIASGEDADNDDLTYVWEQTDTGTVSNVNVDTGDNALFRSRPISSDKVRFIPTLKDLFAKTVTSGELLPVTNREINMAATVRDGKGGLEFDRVKLQVFDTGEQFRVTSQTNNQTLIGGDVLDVSWNVAGTNASPISCNNVDIGLATANGEGIDITTTANDGRAEIIIPMNAPDMNDARLIVSCSNSIFFNVSAGRLTIGEGSGSGGGGGGSFGVFMLLCSLLLFNVRKLRFVN